MATSGDYEQAYGEAELHSEPSSATRLIHIAPEHPSRANSLNSRVSGGTTIAAISPSDPFQSPSSIIPDMPPELTYRHHENIVPIADTDEKVLLGGYEESESDGISTARHPLSEPATSSSSVARHSASSGGGPALRQQVHVHLLPLSQSAVSPNIFLVQ